MKLKLKLKKETLVPPMPLTPGTIKWLMFCLLLTGLWHVSNIPIWAAVAVPAIIGWRYWLMVKKKPLPSRFLRVALTMGAFVGILLTYRSFLGRDPGITAVLLLSSLKLLELKNQRDFMFIVFLCYFLVMGIFLYDQNIPDLTFMVVAVILITAALIRLGHDDSEPVKLSYLLKTSLRFFVLSIPFMAVLFILFPRTSGPLWNLPQDSDVMARSGFNDSVHPGQFAQLATSSVVAFRVRFPDGNMPKRQELYFRGLVLWFTDGRGWYQGIIPARRWQEPTMTDAGIRQEITMEPHFRQWAFGLETTIVTPRRSRLMPGNVFQYWRPVRKPVTYTITSTLHPKYDDQLHPRYHYWALSLPTNGSLRFRRLAQSWREQSASDEEIVQKAMEYFRTNGFSYTLRPGLMDQNTPLEDFFFNKRRGFCEHYAATFAILMRAAGIPTRMVLGYQGGDYNPVGKYLVVRQYDAHAWCEVWLEGKGWQRKDPTAVVSPERIQYGLAVSDRLDSMGPMEEDEKNNAINDATNQSIWKQISKFFENQWDNINYKWDAWIMTYDRYSQRDLLRGLGLPANNRWNLIGILVILVPVVFVLVSMTVRWLSVTRDPVTTGYQQFCRKTGSKGFRPHEWEGPLDFQDRVLDGLPYREKEIKEITGLYVRLRYGTAPADKDAIKQFRKLVRKLKL